MTGQRFSLVDDRPGRDIVMSHFFWFNSARSVGPSLSRLLRHMLCLMLGGRGSRFEIELGLDWDVVECGRLTCRAA